MRTLIVFTGLAALSACSTYTYQVKPLTAEQSEAIEADCGYRPVSKIRGSRSPRDVIYSACRSDTIKATHINEDSADAP
jgi:hypothetical protein